LKRIRLILIFPLLFLIALSNHRAYSGNYVLNKLTYSKYGPVSYKEEIKKKQALVKHIKKSRKAKGIKAEMPQLDEFCVFTSFCFKTYKFPDLTQVFTLAYSGDNLQRGPPTV
jgi:hypothetical protein